MDFKKIMESDDFSSFNKVMNGLLNSVKPGYSYMGFNYNEKEITSVKFYYVFFNITSIDPFPIPELEEEFNNLIQGSSLYHLATPLTGGGGLTFAIKFDENCVPTKGFYFRVNTDNSDLIKNMASLYPEFEFDTHDFEDGYGQYVLIKKEKVKKSEYIYLKNVNKIHSLETKYAIRYGKANSVEISSAASDHKDSHKFIPIGGTDVLTDDFVNGFHSEIKTVIKNLDTDILCPSVSPGTNQHSIYLFAKGFIKNHNTSLVNEFVNVMLPAKKM